MMPGHDSDCNQNSADSTNLDLTQQPETMNPLHITTYIKALPEYTQWMDVFSLLTTNDEDCHHHLEVLRKWREVWQSVLIEDNMADIRSESYVTLTVCRMTCSTPDQKGRQVRLRQRKRTL